LSIGEQGHHSFAEECWDQGFDLEFVYVGSCLFAAKAVIEEELVVLDVLGDAVHFDLGFVHLKARVEH